MECHRQCLPRPWLERSRCWRACPGPPCGNARMRAVLAALLFLVVGVRSRKPAIIRVGADAGGSTLLASMTATDFVTNKPVGTFHPTFAPNVKNYSLKFAMSPNASVFNLNAASQDTKAQVQIDGFGLSNKATAMEIVNPGTPKQVEIVVLSSDGGKGNTTYEVYISQPAPPPPPPPQFHCDPQGVCRPGNGSYTTHNCGGMCRAPPPPPPGEHHYACQPSVNKTTVCLPSSCTSGQGCYKSDKCGGECKSPPAPPKPPGPPGPPPPPPAPVYPPVPPPRGPSTTWNSAFVRIVNFVELTKPVRTRCRRRCRRCCCCCCCCCLALLAPAPSVTTSASSA